MPRERDRLVRYAFHQAAVAGDGVGVVIDDVVAQTRIQHALGERHADGVGKPLAQGPRRRLDAGRVPVLGVAGGLGAELAETLELADVHARIAGEIQQRIEQHRPVARRQDEAVAVGPLGVGGVKAQELAEQHGGDVRHAHGHARVAGLRRLHRVHRQGPDGVRHVLVRDGLQRRGLLARLGHGSILPFGRPARPAVLVTRHGLAMPMAGVYARRPRSPQAA